MNERYTEEFRQEAVRLAITGNTSKADVARDLGVKCSTLHTWIKKYRAEILSSEPIKLNLEDQNKQLRKENARLKEEQEILKKFAMFCAKQDK